MHWYVKRCSDSPEVKRECCSEQDASYHETLAELYEHFRMGVGLAPQIDF